LTATAERTRRLELEIAGMTCASCVRRVERALGGVSGVESVAVNLATGRAEVTSETDIELDDLVAAAQRAGYGATTLERDHCARGEPSDKRRTVARAELRHRSIQLAVGGLLSVGVVIVAYGFGTASWSNWVQLGLATPVWAWVGWIFHRGALKAARHRTVNMDTLVSLGSTVAFVYSVVVTITASNKATYFDTAVLIITLIAVGKFLELLASGKAGEAIDALAGLQPRIAHRLDSAEDDRSVNIDVSEVAVGDLLLVLPGERVPIDAGSGVVDESMITGESMPVAKSVSDEVIGGTVNGPTPLRVRVRRTGDETVLAQILELVDQAQSDEPPIQRLADRISAVFVPTIIAVSVATFLGWFLAGYSVAAAMIPAVAVLVVACPCALGLATPIAILVSSGRGAQLGLLIRGGETLERVHALRTVVLDKTGTLTAGAHKLWTSNPSTDGHGQRYSVSLRQWSERASIRWPALSSRPPMRQKRPSPWPRTLKRRRAAVSRAGWRGGRYSSVRRLGSKNAVLPPRTLQRSCTRSLREGARWSQQLLMARSRSSWELLTLFAPARRLVSHAYQRSAFESCSRRAIPPRLRRPWQARSASQNGRPSCVPRTRLRSFGGCRPTASSRWWATESTTLRRLPRRTLASPSAPEPA
jgi:cation transport ATPase